MRDWPWRELAGFVLVVVVCVAVSAQVAPPGVRVEPQQLVPQLNAKQFHDLELMAKKDPRIEAVARAICRARGVDPDYQGFPYSQGRVWEYFIPQAMLFLAEHDAIAPPGRGKE